jgi:hypothetical protein
MYAAVGGDYSKLDSYYQDFLKPSQESVWALVSPRAILTRTIGAPARRSHASRVISKQILMQIYGNLH